MSDRIASYLIGLGADSSDLTSAFAQVKSRVRSEVAEIKQLTDKLDLFGSLTDNVPKVQQALDKAKQQVQQFTAEVDKIRATGEKAPKALTDALAQAEKAAASATRELARQQSQLGTLSTQLQRAGVDTTNLAAAQAKLADASRAAADAAALAAAKQALGLKTLADVTPEINRQKAAFEALKASGTLSASEIAAAQQLLNGRIKDLNESVSKSGGAFRALQTDAQAAFGPMILQITAATAALAGVGAALSSVTDAAKAYNNGIARVGVVTNLSSEQLTALGGQARAVAQELGIALPEALKSLYEIIRSGVPAENSVEVLRLSALAAKAAFVETGVGAQAAGVLIDSFGIDVKDLGGALDVVARSAQTGGPTLQEFAANAGALGNAVRITGADFKDTSAILNVMADASNDAAGSTQLLTKILINLNRPETRLALHQLGIDGLSLVDTLRALNQRFDGDINQFLNLGIAGTKAAAGLAAIVNNTEKLPAAFEAAANAAGTLAAANAKIYDTPEERKKRFDAALEETKVQLGQSVGASSGLAAALTTVLKAINLGNEGIQKYDAAQAANNKTVEESITSFLNFGGALDTVTPAVKEFHQELIDGQPALRDTAALLKSAFGTLETSSENIALQTAAVQKATADQIASIKERAATEIDLLDKSTAKQAETAAATLAIQAKANTDILAVIKAGQAEVQAALTAAIAARLALAKKSGEDEADTNKAITKLRLEALATDLANYKSFQSQLIDQTKARVAAINSIEQSRIDFNRSINQAIRDINREGETGLQQFADKQKEVDRLIAEGRQVAATQGIAAAEKYFKEAQGISESLKGEVLSDGVVVVSQFQGQQAAITALKKVRDSYNEASQQARKLEEDGLTAAKEKLATVGEAVASLQSATTELRKQLAEGISLQINRDIVGIDAARAQIADLVKPETKVITVITVGGGGGPAPAPAPAPAPGFAGGGPVWRKHVQRFAGGGDVFNRPNWSKVPGVGDGDTVPALLQEGSFVMRKAASQKYGDGMLSMMARGYAGGGGVVPYSDAELAYLYAKSILQYIGKFPFFQGIIPQFTALMDAVRKAPGNKTTVDNLVKNTGDIAKAYPLYRLMGLTSTGAGGPSEKALQTFEEFLAQLNGTKGPAFRFAGGGSVGTDTVPAMLTPGEWVLPPAAVKLYGGGMLSAMNNLQLAPPPVARFANGGPVGDTAMSRVPGDPRHLYSGMGDINVTINAAGGDLSDPRTIRLIAAGLREQIRRTGNSTGLS